MLNSTFPVPLAAGIYQIKNIFSRKSYIGSSVKLSKRRDIHIRDLNKKCHHSRHLQAAWHKYGESAFAFIVLELVEPEYLIEREQFFIDVLLPEYNMSPTAGSPKGVKHTSEARRNMSIAHLGKKPSAELRQKRSIIMKHRWATDPEYRRKCMGMKGREHTLESKRKISETLKGQRLHSERRRKISETLKAKWATPEYRQRMTQAHVGKEVSLETRRRQSEAQKARRRVLKGQQ